MLMAEAFVSLVPVWLSVMTAELAKFKLVTLGHWCTTGAEGQYGTAAAARGGGGIGSIEWRRICRCGTKFLSMFLWATIQHKLKIFEEDFYKLPFLDY